VLTRVFIGLVVLLLVAAAGLAFTVGYTAPCKPAAPPPADIATHKAVLYHCYGPPQVLEYVDVPTPTPGGDEVLVKIKVAAVNPLDWHYLRGSPYFMRLISGIGAPSSPNMGVDFAGTVEAVGPAVSRFKPGDEVFGARGGAFAQYINLPETRAIVKKPDNVSFEQAAAVPVAALTALQALRDKGQLQAGQKVLINGASGGVGTYAVQIARAMGAEVTGVCSARNAQMVRSLGADHVIDYKEQDYTRTGRRYDLIVDNVGNHSPLENRRALNPGGTLVMVGGPGGNWLGPMIRPLTAMLVSPFVDEKLITLLSSTNPEDLAALAGMMEAGELRSVIDSRYPLRETAAAIEHSEAGHARGKILITVP
jgi:NADPH:quinone reductase-like Zn-dependent oxidoreductase